MELIFIAVIIAVVGITGYFILRDGKTMRVFKKEKNEVEKKKEKNEVEEVKKKGVFVVDEVIKNIKTFKYMYSIKTDGKHKGSHLFANDTYRVVIWLDNDGKIDDISIHDNKDKCSFCKCYDYSEETFKKLLFEFSTIVLNVLVELNFVPDEERNSYMAGSVEGYRCGVLIGYHRGNKDWLRGKFEVPNKDNIFNKEEE